MNNRHRTDSFDSLLREAVARRHEDMTRLVEDAQPSRKLVILRPRRHTATWRVAAAVAAVVAAAASMILLRPSGPSEEPQQPLVAQALAIPLPVAGAETPVAPRPLPAVAPQPHRARRAETPNPAPVPDAEPQPAHQNALLPEGWIPVDPRSRAADIITGILAMAETATSPLPAASQTSSHE